MKTYNERDSYAIINSKGKVIETFRVKASALLKKRELETNERQKYEVIQLKKNLRR